MPTRDELYPSQWLKAADCDPPITAMIERCSIEVVGQGAKAERKPVLHFSGGTPKPCVLNRTNFDTLVTLTGFDDCDNWGDTRIELYAIDTTGPNGPTRGIRIRQPRRPAGKPVKKATSPPPVSEGDNDAPF